MQSSLRTFVCRMGAVVVVLALPLLAPTLADASSVSQLRHAFAETFLSLRATRTPGTCSLATAQGRISMIEVMRGQEHYLPTTTCEEAFSEAQQEFLARDEQEECGTAEAFTAFIKSTILKNAIVRVKGKRATIQLVEDLFCLPNGTFVRGAAAVRMDPMGISHWVRRRGRWLFNNVPTGTYSPTGRKSAALLRAALNGRTVTVPEQPLPEPLTVGFCANGISHSTFLGHEGPDPQPWYVTGGNFVNSVFPYQFSPPFDTQGNPQGEVYLIQASIFSGVEWGIKLVGGTPVVTEPSGTSLPVSPPGVAGC